MWEPLKLCVKCKKVYPMRYFVPNRHRKHKITNTCIDCDNKSAIHFGELHPVVAKAHRTIERLIIKGILKSPGVCSLCGEKGVVHAHHDNYHKPKDIRWLCRRCHFHLHHIRKWTEFFKDVN